MISRVFQKSIGSTANNAKKTRMNCSTTTSTLNLSYPEPSSPSSVSLPPLLDHPNTATTAAVTENCSFGSHAPTEHVSCFSTIAAAAASAAASTFNPTFDLAPPPLNGIDPAGRFSRNLGVSNFPSLRSLQENLHFTNFIYPPPPPPPPFQGGAISNWPTMQDMMAAGGGGGGTRMAVGPTELDCMWTF